MKRNELPTDAILRESFIYPESYREGSHMGKKDKPLGAGTALLEAKLNPKYRGAKTRLR